MSKMMFKYKEKSYREWLNISFYSLPVAYVVIGFMPNFFDGFKSQLLIGVILLLIIALMFYTRVNASNDSMFVVTMGDIGRVCEMIFGGWAVAMVVIHVATVKTILEPLINMLEEQWVTTFLVPSAYMIIVFLAVAIMSVIKRTIIYISLPKINRSISNYIDSYEYDHRRSNEAARPSLSAFVVTLAVFIRFYVLGYDYINLLWCTGFGVMALVVMFGLQYQMKKRLFTRLTWKLMLKVSSGIVIGSMICWLTEVNTIWVNIYRAGNTREGIKLIHEGILTVAGLLSDGNSSKLIFDGLLLCLFPLVLLFVLAPMAYSFIYGITQRFYIRKLQDNSSSASTDEVYNFNQLYTLEDTIYFSCQKCGEVHGLKRTKQKHKTIHCPCGNLGKFLMPVYEMVNDYKSLDKAKKTHEVFMRSLEDNFKQTSYDNLVRYYQMLIDQIISLNELSAKLVQGEPTEFNKRVLRLQKKGILSSKAANMYMELLTALELDKKATIQDGGNIEILLDLSRDARERVGQVLDAGKEKINLMTQPV